MDKKESIVLPLLALIFGIASFLTSFTVILGALFGLASIVLSIICFIKKKPVAMSIIGLIFAAVGIIISIIMLVAVGITMSLSSDGLMKKARDAQKTTQYSITEEEKLINYLSSNIFSSTTNESNLTNNVEKNTQQSTVKTNTSSLTSDKISDDWKDEEFTINGKKYKLFNLYSEYEEEGWTFDMADYGYDDGYILNPQRMTMTTVMLKNDSFDTWINIGFENTTDSALSIKKCSIWNTSVDNSFAKKPVTFTLAKGIKNGSSLEEVRAAYGDPDEKYYAEELKYWTYTYDNDLKPELKLTIYEDETKGLTKFSYKQY